MAGKEQETYFSHIQKLPIYTIGVNTVMFVAGVAFIQSPLMDMLVPQL